MAMTSVLRICAVAALLALATHAEDDDCKFKKKKYTCGPIWLNMTTGNASTTDVDELLDATLKKRQEHPEAYIRLTGEVEAEFAIGLPDDADLSSKPKIRVNFRGPEAKQQSWRWGIVPADADDITTADLQGESGNKNKAGKWYTIKSKSKKALTALARTAAVNASDSDDDIHRYVVVRLWSNNDADYADIDQLAIEFARSKASNNGNDDCGNDDIGNDDCGNDGNDDNGNDDNGNDDNDDNSNNDNGNDDNDDNSNDDNGNDDNDDNSNDDNGGPSIDPNIA
jgi:hypothetical protein